jgi:hypothetical protein
LPSGVFKQNAGTDVTTDVIILRKRPSPIDPDHARAQEWVEAGAQRLFDELGGETEPPVNKSRGHSISVITPRPRSLNWSGYVAGKRQLEVLSADEIPPDVMAAVALACLAQIEADATTHQDPAAQNRILNPVRRLREIAQADMLPTPPIPLPYIKTVPSQSEGV